MSRRAFRLMIVVVAMLLPGTAGHSQDAEVASAFVTGTGVPVTFFGMDENPILEIQVNTIEHDWQGYGEYEAPEEGTAYAKVDLSITNVSPEQQEVLPGFFTFYDAMGIPGELTSFREGEALELWSSSDDVVVEPGQTIEGSMVYIMSAEHPVARMAYFTSPQAMIFIGDSEPGPAVATGLNTPVTAYSQDRTPQFEMQVTGIETEWQETTTEPQPGKQFVKVDVTLTNVSDQPISIMPTDVGARDEMGRSSSTANVGTDNWSVDEIPIGPGESQTGSIIFMINADATVTTVTVGQFVMSLIYLGE